MIDLARADGYFSPSQQNRYFSPLPQWLVGSWLQPERGVRKLLGSYSSDEITVLVSKSSTLLAPGQARETS